MRDDGMEAQRMQQLLLPILLNRVITGLVGRATALKALCCGFVSCQWQPQREAVDFCPKCSVCLLLRVLVNWQFRPRNAEFDKSELNVVVSARD
jgi:hypothetical protein